MTLARTIAAFALLLAAGCASSELATNAATDASPGATTSPPIADTGANSATTTDALVMPQSFAFEGALTVHDTASTLDGATLAFFDDADTLACTYSFTADLTREEAPEDEPVLRWWEVDLTTPTPEGDSCASIPDEGLVLYAGLGPYDVRLDPALAAAGLDEAEGYGLYVQMDDGPVWIAGLAATKAQLAGRASPDDGSVSEGTYELTTLLLLPW